MITAKQIETLLKNHKGTTLVGITTYTKVSTAAKYKDTEIMKRSTYQGVIAANVRDYEALYRNKVEKTSNTKDFEVSAGWHEHTAIHALCINPKNPDQFYLYILCNDHPAVSEYYIDGQIATKQQVAAYLTPSAKDKLLNPPAMNHNVTNDVYHEANVRIVKLENIERLAVMGFVLA